MIRVATPVMGIALLLAIVVHVRGLAAPSAPPPA